MLGSWIGNSISIEGKWKEIIERQNRAMERWSKSRISLKGKELVLKVKIMSKVWFLATVNGMPKYIEKEMTKNMKDFLWGKEKKGLMPMEKVIASREEGGLGIPSIEARNKAIQVMWLKKFLAKPSMKPTWAWIAEELIKRNISETSVPKTRRQK